MVTLTTSEAKTAFNDVLDNVFGRDDSSFLNSLLKMKGVEDFFDFVTLTDDTIQVILLLMKISITLAPSCQSEKVKCWCTWTNKLSSFELFFASTIRAS